MDSLQVTLVRRSFALVQPIAPQAAALFYDHLFEADPSLRGLFRGDMRGQGERLMTMIGRAVDLFGQPDVLMPVLRSLGARHLAYGVEDRHYATVGSALMKTLEQGLGDAFTPAVREAWNDLYAVIAATMVEGARAPRVADRASAVAA